MIKNWKEAVEISRISRVNYKAILGMSLTQFLLENKFISNDELLRSLMLTLRKPENRIYLNGISLPKVCENLRISLSARRAEERIYKND